MNNSSLAHTKWECKYHVVFAPKYRRQIIYGKLKADIGKILREICERMGKWLQDRHWHQEIQSGESNYVLAPWLLL